MPELVALITALEDTPKQRIATEAVHEFEQYARKKQSPYWDVTAASVAINTVGKATGSEEISSDDESLLVFEVGSEDATALLDDAFGTMLEETEQHLSEMQDAIRSAGGDAELNSLGNDRDVTEQLISDESFVLAASQLGDRFGDVYRVFDLTNHKHGYPVRSRDELEQIEDQCTSSKQRLYAVKLLARRQ